MTILREGDRVKVLRDTDYRNAIGSIGVIQHVGMFIKVKFNKKIISNDGASIKYTALFWRDELEHYHIKVKPKFNEFI